MTILKKKLFTIKGGCKNINSEKKRKKKLIAIGISLIILFFILILLFYVYKRISSVIVKIIPNFSKNISTNFDYKENCHKYKEYKEVCSSLESRKQDCSDIKKININIKNKYSRDEINSNLEMCKKIEIPNKFCLATNFTKYKEVCLQLKKSKKRKDINNYIRNCVKNGQNKEFCQKNIAKIMYKKRQKKDIR